MLAPIFNAAHIKPSQKHVVWVDVMGSGATMSRSLPKAANFIFKLHVAALEAANPHALTLYPMNDGLYVVGAQFKHVASWLTELMHRLALALHAANGNCDHMFLCRTVIAHGLVVEGVTLAPTASAVLANHTSHRNSILVGAPVSAAYRAEECAPPFGVFVHESARQGRATNGQPFVRPPFHRYWADPKPAWVAELQDDVTLYLKHCENHRNELAYPKDRLAAHRELAEEFFQ